MSEFHHARRFHHIAQKSQSHNLRCNQRRARFLFGSPHPLGVSLADAATTRPIGIKSHMRGQRHFKSHPQTFDSAVQSHAQREIRAFINTEDTAVQWGSNLFRLEVVASALASDGMPLHLLTSEASGLFHLSGLLRLAVARETGRLKPRRSAQSPSAEPIVCSAIFSGHASAVFLREIFVPRIEGHRPEDEAEGQTLTKWSVRKSRRILSASHPIPRAGPTTAKISSATYQV